ncbi:MAG: fumarylacetoacetate hydrolase family protein [Ignavibacteriales bacterium]|nr:fumarylacetoacetate hydrolase family protein [Ignavibacteriales bacterium]
MPIVSLRGTQKPFTVSKIICVGRNYAEHAKEMKVDLPTVPVLFLKPPSAIIREGEDIIIPPISREVHHEVEMTVLLGQGGKNIPAETALEHVAGFGVGLDMTLRDVQTEAKKKGLPWTLAKGFDTSAPLSEFAPAGSVADPHSLQIQLAVNGAVRQKGNTADFIFRLDRLLSLISTYFTLEAGDVIFTGTPEGVAQVAAGDTLEARLLDSRGSTLASIRVGVREQ